MFLGLNIQARIAIMAIIMMFGPMLITRLTASGMFLGGMAILLMSFILSNEGEESFRLIPVVENGVKIMVVAGLIHTAIIKYVAYWPLGPPNIYPTEDKLIKALVASLKVSLGNTARFFASLFDGAFFNKKTYLFPSSNGYSASKSLHSNAVVNCQVRNNGIGDLNSFDAKFVSLLFAMVGLFLTAFAIRDSYTIGTSILFFHIGSLSNVSFTILVLIVGTAALILKGVNRKSGIGDLLCDLPGIPIEPKPPLHIYAILPLYIISSMLGSTIKNLPSFLLKENG